MVIILAAQFETYLFLSCCSKMKVQDNLLSEGFLIMANMLIWSYYQIKTNSEENLKLP